jgi:hypothetical protein
MLQGTVSITSGTVYAAMAITRTAGTWTKIRFATGGTAASGLTAARLGVWDASATLLADFDATSLAFAASTLYDNNALSTNVTLSAGQQVWLGISVVASTTPSLRGATNASATNLLSVQLTRTSTGYASGSLPALGSGATGFLPWIELVP